MAQTNAEPTVRAHPSAGARAGSRVYGFDGLRALAALVVFFEHRVRDIGTGAIGVWVFFCLSGYLIVGILHRARREVEAAPDVMTTRRALLHFWKNRALRILPLYYAVLFALFGFTSIVEARAFPYYLFYLQNVYIGLVSHQWSACSHFWSLALEQQFYLASAPLLLLVPARLHERTLAIVFSSCVVTLLGAELAHFDPLALSLLPPTSFAFMALGGLARLTPKTSLGARH
jgi:peptidoglycan/LPS O-acetylase OafA/YrhL